MINSHLNLNFKAIPLATYSLPPKKDEENSPSLNNDETNIRFQVLELEPKDSKDINSILGRVKDTFAKKLSDEEESLLALQEEVEKQKSKINELKSKNQIMNGAFLDLKDILEKQKANDKDFKKTKSYLAVYEGQPYGLAIGHIPKKLSSNNEKICYSSRHNPSNKETELDWIVTWNFPKKVSKVGTVLMNEFLNQVQNSPFEEVFLHSTSPDKSFALSFYQRMGFSPKGSPESLDKKTLNKCLINSDDTCLEGNKIFHPMSIDKFQIRATTEAYNRELQRTEPEGNEKYSQSIGTFLDITER